MEMKSRLGGLRPGMVEGSARLAAILLVVGAAASPAWGDGIVRDSIGPISSGRGGTNLAFGDNLSLINDNPAGLTRLGGIHAELNLDFLTTDIEYQDPQNDVEAKDQWFVLPSAALSWRVKEAPYSLTLGLGMFVPAGYGAEYRMVHPVYGSQKYISEAGLYKFLVSASTELGPRLSLGVGGGLAYQTLDVDSPYTFQTGAFMGVPGLIDLDVDGFGFAWNIGLQYRATDRWTIGLAYIAETRTDLEGDFDVDVTGVVPVPDPTATYRASAVGTFPRSVGVGTAYRFDAGSLSIDGLWYDWSSAFDDFEFSLSHGDNPTFDVLAGTTRPSDTFPLKWRDSFTIRVGGEYYVTPEATVRAGYIYIQNPVPDGTLTPLIPAILEHSFTVGYGHRFGPARVDLSYQYSFSRTQHVNTSDVIGGDFDQSSLRAVAHWILLGVHVDF